MVASDHISVQQIIRQGENGLMAKCGDANDLSVVLMSIINSKSNQIRIAKNGYDDACFKYSFEYISNLLDDFFRHVGN